MPLFDPAIFDPAIFDTGTSTPTRASQTYTSNEPRPLRRRQTQKIERRKKQAAILQVNLDYLTFKHQTRINQGD